MDRSLARRVALVGIALGLLIEVALDGPAAGLNVPLVVGAILAAGLAFRRPGRPFDRLDAWLPVGALTLAGFVAIRGDDFLVALDILGAVAFGGATLIAMAGVPLTRRSVRTIAAMGLWLADSAATGIRRVVPHVAPRVDPDRRRLGRIAPIARGLAIAIPLATVFAVLFASADPIFRRGLDDLAGLRIDLGALPGRVLFTLSAAWLCIGSLVAVVLRAPDTNGPGSQTDSGLPADAPSPAAIAAMWPVAPTTAQAVRIDFGWLEAMVILVVIDIVVGAFVGLQLAYLFGGLDTLAAAQITYSDYARRGFFELVAAAVLAGVVVAALEAVVHDRSRRYIVAGLVLLGLTGAVLVSAAYRLSLYQAAYGWTELRFYVFTAIAYVAVALAVLGSLLVVRRTRWFAHGLAVLGFVGLLALNLAAPASFVAERNLERILDPRLVPADGRSGLDADYLAQLPDDAIVPMILALDRLPGQERTDVLAILEARRAAFGSDPSLRGPMAWNLARERAREALTRLP